MGMLEKAFEQINKKLIVQGVMGVLIARVWLFGMNPFVVAFFLATYMENQYITIMICALLIGMGSSVTLIHVIKYALVFAVVMIVKKMGDRTMHKIPLSVMSVIAAFTSFALSITDGILNNTVDYLMLSSLELVIILAFVNLFRWGIRYMLYSSGKIAMNNEELISIVVLVVLSLYGAPNVFGETLSYLFALYMGYKYGAAHGAIAGAGCGILAAMNGGGLILIGMYCLLGISVGMFREIGKIGSGMTFLIIGFILTYIFKTEILEVDEIKAMVTGVILFYFIPKTFLFVVEDEKLEKESVVMQQGIRSLTKLKMDEFADSFSKLSKTLENIPVVKRSLDQNEIQYLFNDLSHKLCSDCTNCTYCWDKHYYDTYQGAYNLIGIADEKGRVGKNDISAEFVNRCIRVDDYILEANQLVSSEKIRLNYENRLAESRETLAKQIKEVSEVIQDFSKEIYDTKELDIIKKRELLSVLRINHLQVKKVTVFEKRNKMQEIVIEGRARKGYCLTTNEIEKAIQQVLGKRFRASEELKKVIPKEWDNLVFVEDTNFKTLTGMARIAKTGEKISGDNFSFLHLSSGEMIMVLSDGMGSGKRASLESETVVELLENLMEAGFSETSAIRLINSMLVVQSEGQMFSTVDMSVLNLYTGVCNIVKNGASATFIKRNGMIETIYSSALPVGIVNNAEPEGITKKLYDGDIIVMVTDGVTDCFPGDEKEFYIENILKNTTSTNPQEIANQIINQAVQQNNNGVMDDMSVMVAGIWKKS